MTELVAEVREHFQRSYGYIELRPRWMSLSSQPGFLLESQHYLHALDLTQTIDQIYRGLHKDSVRRKIRRAEREGVALEQGRSEELLLQFYEVFLRTRRRHGLPPQPVAWFRNLVECLGDRVTILVARLNTRPIASLLTIRHKLTLVYKYGGSDERFHRTGGVQWLFWQAIQDAKSAGLCELDLGRTERGNKGLIRFKEQLGAVGRPLSYWRSSRKSRGAAAEVIQSGRPRRFLSVLPDRLLRAVGEMFYRHAG